jgi:hypothetical protein
MVMKDRQEQIRRDADEARLERIAVGRPRTPVKPRRMRVFSRR